MCVSGACVSSCDTAGQEVCGGACVDRMSNAQHCGLCGHDCGALANVRAGASVSCSAGACVIPQAACVTNYVPAPGGAGCELPRFQPLPISLGAGIQQDAQDVSADGLVVVGDATDFLSSEHIFRWTPLAGLEDLTSLVSDTGPLLTGTSHDGSLLTGLSDLGMFQLAPPAAAAMLPTPTGATKCAAGSPKVTSDGSTIVGICSGGVAPTSGARWRRTAGQFQGELLSVPTGFAAWAPMGVSADGAIIVGWAAATAGGVSGIRWTNGAPEVLGFIPGSTVTMSAYPNGTSGDGRVIVGSVIFTSATGSRGVRWTSSSAAEQLPLPTAGANTSAYDANQDGSVIVGAQQLQTAGEALLWDFTGVHYVRDLLLAEGVNPADLTGWSLRSANAVSADGKVIFGTGTNPMGQQETWIARLR